MDSQEQDLNKMGLKPKIQSMLSLASDELKERKKESEIHNPPPHLPQESK